MEIENIKDDINNQNTRAGKLINCTNEIEQYRCNRCNFQTIFLASIKHHRNNGCEHKPPDELVYRCLKCNFSAHSKYIVVRHSFFGYCSTTNVDKQENSSKNKKIVTNEKSLFSSMDLQGSTQDTESSQLDSLLYEHSAVGDTNLKDAGCFKCGHCCLKFILKEHLNTHIKYRHSEDQNTPGQRKLSPLKFKEQVHLNEDKNAEAFQSTFSEYLPPQAHLTDEVNMSVNKISVLKTNFSRFSSEDKLKVKQLGRPLPDLNLQQISERKAQNRTFMRHFSRDIYDRNSWICGCEVSNLLYCFPCVLFYNPAKTGASLNWARTGIKDLHHLPGIIRKHESSRSHINACIRLALLGEINITTQFSSAYQKQITEHNELVKKNRYILKRIISCVKFCGAFESALRGHRESEESKNREIFTELIDFSSELDTILRGHLQKATIFKETSKTIQNDILDSMLAMCKETICDQIKSSDFLAIQYDDTTDVTNLCQMVLIFRYVFDGTVRENFWCFKTVHDKSAAGIQKCIEEEIDPIIQEAPQKLIAQTYDGANVMSGAVGGVQAYIKKKYPCAYYIHCYSHQLNLVIQNAASRYTKVRIFFSNLSAIPAFFSNCSNRCDILEEIIKNRLPDLAATRWNYNIRTVNSVYDNREKLIEVFEEIEEKCLRTVTSNEASGLRRALEDPEFLFWLIFFKKIFPHVEILYSQIQLKNKDSIKLQKNIETFEISIRSIRSETDTIQSSVEDYFHTENGRTTDNLSRSVCAREVCDVIISQMKDRFSYRGHLEAAELFDPQSMQGFSKTFPLNLIETVCSAYPFLDKVRLKIELQVIYTRPDFGQIIGATNFLSLILQHNLTDTFPETVKLLKIILTTPMTTAESERCFPTLERVKSFLRNTMDNDRLNALAMICINRNLVQDIDNFDEKVLEKFVSMENRRAEFTFKK